MKTIFLTIISIIWAATGLAAERLPNSSVLSAEPETKPADGRGLGSIPSAADGNDSLFMMLKPGDVVMVQNSFPGWEDEMATVVDKFEDHRNHQDNRIRFEIKSGKRAWVKLKHLRTTISPEVKCGMSHEVEVCKNQKVFYPARSASLALPEGNVEHIFENNTVIVHDGDDFVLDLKQVGKSVDCSPQRPDICVNQYVLAEGMKNDQPVTFEGTVEKAYTHGVVLVRSDSHWIFPIDVNAVKKRIAQLKPEPAAVLTRRDLPQKLPSSVKVSPEIEPRDAHDADHANDAR